MIFTHTLRKGHEVEDTVTLIRKWPENEDDLVHIIEGLMRNVRYKTSFTVQVSTERREVLVTGAR